MAALTPAAHASPPDQTWIAGLNDNADCDDAVLASIASGPSSTIAIYRFVVGQQSRSFHSP